MEKEKEEREEIQQEQTEKGNNNTTQSPQMIDEMEQFDSAFSEEIEYEEISTVETSPMNEAVKQGEVSEGTRVTKEQTPQEISTDEETEEGELPPELLKEFEKDSEPPTDAPEQEINASDEEAEEVENSEPIEGKEVLEAKSGLSEADHHAGIAADSLIGVADNLLETGGGFFIKIKKSASYHDFDKQTGKAKADPESLNAIVDGFNEKNIKRLKLDEEDKRQLKPVLKEVLKRQTKAMTPEQQLMALGISILIKKGQAVIEMRKESQALKKHFDTVVKQYFEEVKAINIEVVEQQEKVKAVELKGEENEEKGEDNPIKQAA